MNAPSFKSADSLSVRRGLLLQRLKLSRAAPARLLCGLVWSLRNSIRHRTPVLIYQRADGSYINQRPEVTFLSPEVHAWSYQDVVDRVRDEWLVEWDLSHGTTILDIGAGIGDEVVVFSRAAGPDGRVIAVEAHPATCGLLRETVRINGLSNVSVIECAASELPGSFSMATGDSHLDAQLIANGMGDKVEVMAKPIPILLDELGIETVDFLKMNIEGAELPALRGCVGQFHRIRRMAVSCHDFIAEVRPEESWMRTYEEVIELLRSNGYRVTGGRHDPRPWVRYYVYATRD